MAALRKFCTHQAANFPSDSWVHTHTYTRQLIHTFTVGCPLPLHGSTGVLPDSGGKPGCCTRTRTLLSWHHIQKE